MLRKLCSSMLVGITLGSLIFIRSQDQAPIALTGVVSSDAEGRMEGVLVSAKRVDGTITVTVVSDNQGRYAFPASRLKPGKYRLAIRAIGYDPANPRVMATVGSKTAAMDIKLNQTLNLVSQMSGAEWLISVPGTDEQKDAFYGCVHCHNLTPALTSRYDAKKWLAVVHREHDFAEPSTILKGVKLPFHEEPKPGDVKLAEYLSTIDLGSKSKWDYELKTLPRPTRKETRVIVTEYDLPRPDRQPHDAVIDAEGMVWYTDFALPLLGRLNPRTGETKEWPLPLLKQGFPPGSLDVELDPQGNPWIGRLFQGGIAKFDKKTEKVTSWSLPPGCNNVESRTGFLAFAPDGSVWFTDQKNRRINKLDPKTGHIDCYPGFPGWKPSLDLDLGGKGRESQGHYIYGINADSKGNAYFADIGGGNIGVMDPTGKVKLYPTPTPNSGPRRMHMDSQDRLWFAEHYTNKFALFDTKTKQFQEWPDPTPWDGPYDVVCDKHGNLWTGSMSTDLVTRFNPQTGEYTRYLLPRLGTNVRRVDVDNSASPPIFWVGENHHGKIAKLEPLE